MYCCKGVLSFQYWSGISCLQTSLVCIHVHQSFLQAVQLPGCKQILKQYVYLVNMCVRYFHFVRQDFFCVRVYKYSLNVYLIICLSILAYRCVHFCIVQGSFAKETSLNMTFLEPALAVCDQVNRLSKLSHVIILPQCCVVNNNNSTKNCLWSIVWRIGFYHVCSVWKPPSFLQPLSSN